MFSMSYILTNPEVRNLLESSNYLNANFGEGNNNIAQFLARITGTLATCSLILFLYSNSRISNFINHSATLNYLGDISYCVYLIHFPLLCLIMTLVYTYAINILNRELMMMLTFVLEIIFSLYISGLIYKYLDKKMINYSKNINLRKNVVHNK